MAGRSAPARRPAGRGKRVARTGEETGSGVLINSATDSGDSHCSFSGGGSYNNGTTGSSIGGSFQQSGNDNTSYNFSSDLSDSGGVWTQTDGSGSETETGRNSNSYSGGGDDSAVIAKFPIAGVTSPTGTQNESGGNTDNFRYARNFIFANGLWTESDGTGNISGNGNSSYSYNGNGSYSKNSLALNDSMGGRLWGRRQPEHDLDLLGPLAGQRRDLDHDRRPGDPGPIRQRQLFLPEQQRKLHQSAERRIDQRNAKRKRQQPGLFPPDHLLRRCQRQMERHLRVRLVVGHEQYPLFLQRQREIHGRQPDRQHERHDRREWH